MGVKIKEHQGMIAAQIPFDDRHRVNQLKIGKWVPEWKCWLFAKTPSTAHTLISEFKDEIEILDDKIKFLASTYEEATSNKYKENLPNIPGININAWNHQRQAFYFAKDMPGIMLSMAMGTGKSLTAIGLIANNPHDKVLIVCPKSVIPVWPKELERANEKMQICPLDKKSILERAEQMKTDMQIAGDFKRPLVVIVNYESFWHEKLAKIIEKNYWDIVIFDEIHRLKQPSGKASKFAAKLYKNSGKRLGLTGTPMPHSPVDIFAQYRALDYSIYGTNFHRFKQRFCVLGGYGGKQIVDYQRQDELAEKFEKIAIQIKSDVLDLPEAIHNYRSCQLDAKTWKHYHALDNEFITELEEGIVSPANALVKLLRLQQLTSGYLKTDDGDLINVGNEKKRLLRDLLTDIPRDESIIVFAKFTADIANIKEVCESKEIGRHCCELSGNINELKSFQDGNFDSIAIQVKSGGLGIDLTRARYCIYYSIGHSLGDYLQSLARTHRPGQERTIYYYHLVAKKTIDVDVYNALQKRQEIIDYILSNLARKI